MWHSGSPSRRVSARSAAAPSDSLTSLFRHAERFEDEAELDKVEPEGWAELACPLCSQVLRGRFCHGNASLPPAERLGGTGLVGLLYHILYYSSEIP